MAEVVGVVFRGGIKVYHFDPAGLELCRGDRVVVQTMHGVEIGQVVEPPHVIDDAELPAPLKKVARVATAKDIESLAATEDLRRQAMDTCREMIDSHGLDMKLVGADIGFGGEKITFSFYSEDRVDFRALVGDLAKALKMRIELRQVGAREEARMVGGLGPCGRSLCCTLFPGDDEPVSIRMAKEQNLPLNPAKISGLCGRLMCCLKYEQEQYVRFRKEAPSKGTPVSTPGGQGVVAGYNVTKDAIIVRMEDGSFTDVRLGLCETQEDGSIVALPEEQPPVPVSWLDSPIGIDRLVAADDERVVEAEVILGEDGEPVEVVVAEGSRRSRSRRQRGRRKNKGRGREQAAGEDSDAAADRTGGTAPGAARSAGESRSGASSEGRSDRRRGGRSGRRSEHRAELRREGPAGTETAKEQTGRQRPGRSGTGVGGGSGAGGSRPSARNGTSGTAGRPGGGEASGDGGEAGGAKTGSGSSRARRRRRPRRPGGGPNGGSDGSGGGGRAGDGGGDGGE